MTTFRLSAFAPLVGAFVLLATAAVGASTTPPKLIKAVQPKHPQEFWDKGLAGEAKVTFVIDENGGVSDVTVTEASDPAFGEAAVEAVKQWKFEPATRDGKPVSLKVSQPFSFPVPLEHSLAVMMGRPVFVPEPEDIIDEGELSTPLQNEFFPTPGYPKALLGSGTVGEATVSFIVGADGLAINPEVTSVSDKQFALSAIIAVLKGSWTPPTRDGAPVNVRTKVVLEIKEPPPPPPPPERGRGRGESNRRGGERQRGNRSGGNNGDNGGFSGSPGSGGGGADSIGDQ